MPAMVELAGLAEASGRSGNAWLDVGPRGQIMRAIGSEPIRDTLAVEGG